MQDVVAVYFEEGRAGNWTARGGGGTSADGWWWWRGWWCADVVVAAVGTVGAHDGGRREGTATARTARRPPRASKTKEEVCRIASRGDHDHWRARRGVWEAASL